MIQNDMTQEEQETFQGFVVATDRFMSGWGMAPGKSYIATPYFSDADLKQVMEVLEGRKEMKHVRVVGRQWHPRLRSGDHCHIYDGKAFRRAS